MNKMTPQIRFQGFTDDWEERKFEDLLDSKDGVRRGPFGSALKKEFFVENSEYVVYEQQNAIYDNYHTRYKITKEKFDELSKFKLNPGDFIMSGAGTIGRISRVPDGVKLGVFNQALIRFRINPEITDSEFFIQFVRADFMQKNLTGANPGSAITNLVPMSEVKKWEIKAPHLEEQEKIGSFFKLLDDTIALHQRMLDLLKEQKQGFLQKMFSKNGSKVPELRFSGFADDWEERKLTDIVSRLSKTSNNSELPKVEFEDIVAGEGRLNKDVSHKFDDRKGILFESQNILYGKLRPYLKNWLLADFKGIALGDFWVFQSINSDPKFVYSLIQSNHYQKVANDTSGTKMPRSDWKKVSSTVFTIPNYEEQQKIGSFFKYLDDTIALHQRKLDLLKEQKKGFLQKMFVS